MRYYLSDAKTQCVITVWRWTAAVTRSA